MRKIKFPIENPPWLLEIIKNKGIKDITIKSSFDFLVSKQKLKISIEGIPGGGKTSLVEFIRKKKIGDIIGQYVIQVDLKDLDNKIQYINNDRLKDHLYIASKAGITIFDRDFISTIAYEYSLGKKNSKYYDLLVDYY
jgi:hypothetical protein